MYMIGCCDRPKVKFASRRGVVDQKRLEDALERIKNWKIPDDQKKKIIQKVSCCRCPCHRDTVFWACQ
jgi:hypothetical protein